MADWDKELRDSWEAGGLQIPSIAFGDHRKGDGFKGAILLPITEAINANPTFVGKGYYELAQMEPEFLVNPKTGKRDVENPKYGEPRRWEKGFSRGQIMQDTILFLMVPEFAGKDLSFDTLVSEKYLERVQTVLKGESQDDADFLDAVVKLGLRRLFVTGGSLAPNFRASVKRFGGPPSVGASLSVVIDDMEPNDSGGKTKIYGVDYQAPTAENLAQVEKFMKQDMPLVASYLLAGRAAQESAAPNPQAAAAKEHEVSKADAADDDEPPF